MKICICVNGRPHEGGVTTFINNMANGLRASGHHVDIVSIFGKSEYRKIKTKLVTKTDKILKNKPLLTLIVYLLSKVVLTWHIFLNYFINRYDLIWTIDMSVANIANHLKLLTKKIKIINFPIGDANKELADQGKIKNNSLIQRYFKKEERKALKKSDLNFCPSIHLGHIKNLTKKHSPIFFIKTPVDIKKFYSDTPRREKKRKSLGISLNTFVILSVSRLAYRKGVRYPAMALKKIIEEDQDKNYQLIYAGEGPEKAWLENFRKKNKLEPYIKLIGRVKHEKIINLFRTADCFTFCSITDGGIIESHSHSPIEAMACGIPVIAFDTFNPEEPESEKVFTHEKNCLLVKEKDIDMLAEAIKKIKSDEIIRKKIINGGINYLKENDHTPKFIAQKIINQIRNYEKTRSK